MGYSGIRRYRPRFCKIILGSMENIIIIGAGAAGLAAARDLATAGVRVTILEARERIGGRLYTYYDSSSAVPIELGAELVHGKHPALMKVLEESMIPFCDVSERHLYFDKGKLINSHEFRNELTALMDLLSLDKPDQTFKEFLASLPDNYMSHQASEVASLFVQGFHAASIDRIGTHGLVKAREAEDEIDGEKGFRVLGGYARVVQALYDQATAYGADVRLQTVVQEIRWKSEGVEAWCASGGEQQQFRAARVLITLPLGVLQADPDQPGAVRFVPQLPEEKRSAIQTLAMGHALRITLVFRERFWERLEKRESMSGEEWSQFGFIHNPEASLPTWWTQLHIRAPVLVGWSGGQNAERLSQLTEEALLSEAFHSLQEIFEISESELRRQFVSFHTHNWSSDPFSRGAYAYLPVNGLELQQTLARPIDEILFFAGEATSVGHIGTVHGAIETGQRAAKEILKRP